MLKWLLFILVSGCGLRPQDDPGPTAPVATLAPKTELSFADNINPILQNNCGACHSPGAKQSVFVGDEKKFQEMADDVVMRITSGNPKAVMPPPKARDPLSDTDKKALLKYLNK